jgi:hypothetical protein
VSLCVFRAAASARETSIPVSKLVENVSRYLPLHPASDARPWRDRLRRQHGYGEIMTGSNRYLLLLCRSTSNASILHHCQKVLQPKFTRRRDQEKIQRAFGVQSNGTMPAWRVRGSSLRLNLQLPDARLSWHHDCAPGLTGRHDTEARSHSAGHQGMFLMGSITLYSW